MKRTIKPLLTLLFLPAVACWISGCNTTAAQMSQPAFIVENSDLKTMWGGRIGEQLAPAGPAVRQPSGTSSERTGSVSRQYREWKRTQDS